MPQIIFILAIIGALTLLCLFVEVSILVVSWMVTSGIWHDLRKWRKKQK